MNWRLALGQWRGRLTHAVLASRVFPLTRVVPHGVSWLYDVQRFAGTRRLSVVIDAGANIGQTVQHVLRYAPGAQVFCFEPVQATYDVLSRRYEDQPNVLCLRQALGSAPAQRPIRIHRDSERNTLVLDGDGGHTELVTITTIDKVCEAHQIARIDVLKMDVQGWELEVLRGAERMLDEDRIDFVFSEVGFRRADGDMQHFAALNDFLEARGFWLCGFYDHYRWGPNRRYLGFSSALYTKRRDALVTPGASCEAVP